MDMDSTVIRLDGVAFGYDPATPVFRNLNLELGAGERVGLMGPNGAGKSTLFHIIVGLLKPEAGSVEVFGKRRTTERDFQKVREKVGLLFQDSNDQLFCPTVAEDVAFGPLNLGVPPADVHAVVRETLAAVGLHGFEERVTHNLSGGEKKLVALSTVLSMKPEVLLLDEPTAGLDEDSAERILNLLQELPQPRIVISQDRDVLQRVTDTIWLMRDGGIRDTSLESSGVN